MSKALRDRNSLGLENSARSEEQRTFRLWTGYSLCSRHPGNIPRSPCDHHGNGCRSKDKVEISLVDICNRLVTRISLYREVAVVYIQLGDEHFQAEIAYLCYELRQIIAEVLARACAQMRLKTQRTHRYAASFQIVKH